LAMLAWLPVACAPGLGDCSTALNGIMEQKIISTIAFLNAMIFSLNNKK